MRIVQSYWGKPTLGKTKGLKDNRHNGGWLSEKDHCMAWALSCLKFKEFYDEVELYTDQAGKEWLIDQLRLPYTKVHVCMEALNAFPPLLWALPKIYTYSLQTTPFIHADGDVFIWERFSESLEQSPLIAQNIETNFEFYPTALQFIFNNATYIPPAISSYDWRSKDVLAVNAGILGGNDLVFIQDFCKEAFVFAEKNHSLFLQEEAGKSNIIIEQYLFYHLAAQQGKQINCLISDPKNDFSNLIRFNLVPAQCKYIHLVGKGKQSELACQLVQMHLKYEFPEMYYHIESCFQPDKKINGQPVQAAIEKKITNHFSKSLQLLHHYSGSVSSAAISYNEFIKKTQETLESPLAEKTKTLLKDIFRFETEKYTLLTENKELFNPDYSFTSFCKAKKLLSDFSHDSILNKKYTLGKGLKMIELSYPVPDILERNDWFEWITQHTEQAEPDEFLYILEKENDDLVHIRTVSDITQLLYYFSLKPITGTELVEFLAKEYPGNSPDHYKDLVFDFVTKGMAYGGHLQVCE